MIPIALLIDDSCPLIHVYRCHTEDVHGSEPVTKDGRPMLDTIPNAFLDRFCDVVEHRGMAGKLSIVPAPGGRGDVVRGIEGFPPDETRAWIETAQRRLGARFDFCPEGISHNLTLDLATGEWLPIGENDWSQTQPRETLTPYLVRQLELLKAAGVDATGFTSPWVFGIKVEPEYIAAMVAAQRQVYGRDSSWYFLHMIYDRPGLRPWVAHQDERGRLVSIAATGDDYWWATIEDPQPDVEAIARRAYEQMVWVAEGGGVPVALTHWQSLFSNGLENGLRALDRFGALVAADGRFTWQSCSELAEAVPEKEAAA